MIVNGVTSRLPPGLDTGVAVSDKKNNNEVRGETSDKGVNGETSIGYFDKADYRDYVCEKFIVTNKAAINRGGKGLTMLEGTLIIFKFFVFLMIISNDEILVSGAINPKGDIKVDVTVPKEAELDGYADLRCEYRLSGGKSLYSVKWYKDDHEIFRYLPDNGGSTTTFVREGVLLDEKASSKNSIRLKSLTLKSSGQYKCEISTEGPSFATGYKTGNLTVITLPEQGPQITGLSTHYAVGENVTANCTAWPSIPKARLHWTINGKSVPKEYTILHPPLQPVSSFGIPNSLGLRLVAEARHFDGSDGSVSIRCVSYVGSKRYEVEKTVHMAHVNNQRLSAGDLRNGGTSYNTHDSTKHRYQLTVFFILLGFYVST